MSMWNRRDSEGPERPVEPRPNLAPPVSAPASPAQSSARRASIIGGGVTIKGEIVAKEELVIDGEVEGTVESQDKLTVGVAGKLRAQVKAREIIVRGQVKEAVTQGAQAWLEERGEGAYLGPQILTNVKPQMRVMSEETFGPVLPIVPVDSDDEALAAMNASDYGLTAAIWTRDATAAEKLGDALETGTVFMNRCDYLDPALVWTGVKETGRGGSLSVIGFHNLTRPKSYHFKKLS